jgi:hypothetical protein
MRHQMPLSTLNRMECGASYEAVRAEQRRAKRRRRHTAAACMALVVAVLAKLVLTTAVRAAANAAAARGEQCWPLAGRHARAVVVATQPPRLLWHPRYVKDEAPGDVIRAHERSVLCPELRTRIRPKRVNVSHAAWRQTLLADKTAVCVLHYTDFFAHGAC